MLFQAHLPATMLCSRAEVLTSGCMLDPLVGGVFANTKLEPSMKSTGKFWPQNTDRSIYIFKVPQGSPMHNQG